MTGIDVPALEATVEAADTAPEFGTLRVIVEPWGRVVLDGRDVGGTPYSGRVHAGEHAIEGVAGERRTRRSVQVEADETTRVTLRVR